jgi:RNA polymerase sigma factor (sigma-70 family)
MGEQLDKFWRRRRVTPKDTPQDTLKLVKASVHAGDTSIAAAYLKARDKAFRSGCDEERAHDLGTEVMVLVADKRGTDPSYLTDPKTFDDEVFKLMVKCRQAEWQRNRRHLELESCVAYQLHTERSTADDAEAVLNAIDTPHIRRAINRAVAELTLREREILVKRRIKNRATSVVANQLGIAEGTVRVELCHGVKKMRDALRLVFPNTRHMEEKP